LRTVELDLSCVMEIHLRAVLFIFSSQPGRKLWFLMVWLVGVDGGNGLTCRESPVVWRQPKPVQQPMTNFRGANVA
jgi:hypothetical protein